jgi:4-amino-4-deoxy-L-arabinose transferase-like glycosyltransferase
MACRRPTRTAVIAAALLLAALVIRVAEVETTSYRPVNDAGSYLTLASEIAHTGDYSSSDRPGTGAGGTRGPTAYFPPGFPYFLAAVDAIGSNPTPRGAAIEPARLSQAVLGAVTVALLALVAFELFGETVALIALALAAIYPVLVELSAVLVAENLMTALVLAATWAMLRARRSARPYRWITATGVLTGVAALTHVNSILVIGPLAYAAWRVRRGWAAPAALVAATLLTLAPWTVRNLVELHRFTPVTDETGITLVGTYNGASASYQPVPYKWRIYYGIPGERPLIRGSSRLTEPELSSRLESQALSYIGRHPLAPIAVAYHNSLRLLELEGSFAWHASASAMGISEQSAEVGVLAFWALCLLALAGAFTGAVRTAPRWLWVEPLLLWLSVAVINAETPRFREPVDPFLILTASCALAAAPRAARRLARAPVGSQRGPAVPAGVGELVEMVERLA